MKIEDWANLSGAFMINFGAAEIATFQWIIKYSTDAIVKDIALQMPLNRRIKLVCDLVTRSALPDERKKQALELWEQIAKLAEMRNVIAHSPFITNTNDGKEEHGFINVKKMKGDGPFEILPLSFEDIAHAGSTLAKILPQILKPF